MTTWFVCSGGASKGPYAAGVLKYCVHEKKMVFDGFAGTSVGGIIAGHQAMYRKDQAEEACHALERLLTKVRTEDIWRDWRFFGKAAGLWKQSMVDSSPLNRLIRKSVDDQRAEASDRELRITAVSLNTRGVKVFDKSFRPLWKAIAATAAMPMLFLPICIDGELWVDGGVRIQTPIQAAIDAGASRIVAVTLSSRVNSFKAKPADNAIEVGLGAVDAMLDELAERDIKIANLYNQLLQAGAVPGKRAVQILHVRPFSPLVKDSLSFDPKEAREIYLRGFADAASLDFDVA